MKSLLLQFSLALLALSSSVLADGKESPVLTLTKSNFKEALETHNLLLVEFYAPWCGHCKALEPEYAKAAQEIEDAGMEFKLAKVDATEEKELAEQYEVRGYPTIKFFKYGVPKDYNGGRKAADIVQWLENNVGPAVAEFSTVEDVKAFVDKTDTAVMGYFTSNDTDEAQAYIFAADSGSIDGMKFGATYSSDVAKAMEAEMDSVVLYKKFDDGKVVFPGVNWTSEAIIGFISDERLPYVTTFSDETAPIIFGGTIKNHLLAFFPEDHAKKDEYMEHLGSVGKNFRGKVVVVFINTKDEQSARVMEFFGLEESQLPAVRLISLGEDMKKFVPPTSEIDKEKLGSFVQDFMDGKLTPHFNTEEVPEDWDSKPVKVLVGKNFREIALDTSKHVFVEFYAPWCGHCKQLAPIWDKLGEHFKDDSDVIIAKMDATKNEIDEVQVTGFPTLKFFPKDSEKHLDYEGGRTLEEMIKYVEDRVAGKPVEEDMEPPPPEMGEEEGDEMIEEEGDTGEDPAEPPKDEL